MTNIYIIQEIINKNYENILSEYKQKYKISNLWDEELMLRGNLKQWVCLFKSKNIKINHLWFYFRKRETEVQIKSKASGKPEINTRAKLSEIENRSIEKNQ